MTGPGRSASPAPDDRAPAGSRTPDRPPARPAPRRRDSPPPQTAPGEKDVLLGFLNYLRTPIAAKLEGAPEPDVRTPVASGTNLLGLVTHLTHVERRTFLGEDVPIWPATFHPAADDTVHGVLAAYRAAVDQANELLATCNDLTAPPSSTRKNTPSLRWALVHDRGDRRHAGHADILRELIDGRTGR